MKLKNLIVLATITIITLNFKMNTLAATPFTYNYSIENYQILERAEETAWYFRIVDGKPQKRLWSLTFGKWLTDWQWIE